tara:strand:- start:19 stop:312 length:294 start_codon:yes stop_codon:yes gene_type:complete
MSKKVDKFLEEAVENIRSDREITRELLDDAIKWLSKDESRHQNIGITLSKYVETLQRSNEQLVKVAGLMAKNEGSGDLTDSDMEDIYKMINKEDKDE